MECSEEFEYPEVAKKVHELVEGTKMLIIKMTLNSIHNLLFCVILFTTLVISNILPPKDL